MRARGAVSRAIRFDEAWERGGLMKKAIFILVVVLLPVLYYLGVFSEEETLPLSKEFFSIETSSGEGTFDPETLGWIKIRGTTNPLSLSSKDLEELYQAKLDRGIRNLPLLSWVLMRRAQEAKKRGQTDEALRLALYAQRFSPDFPEPSFVVARARWSENPFQVTEILRELLRGIGGWFRHYPHGLKIGYNALFLVGNGVLMAFMVLGVFLLVKYVSLYVYDIRKNLTGEISRLFTQSLKILIFFLPFFLRLDLLWALLFWSLLMWGYATKRERFMVVCFLIALTYLPFFLRSVSHFLESPVSGILMSMNRANHQDWDRSVEEKLREWVAKRPGDALAHFTLGLIEKRRGHYSQAESSYQRALEIEPRFHEALSNLGNVYLAQKQFDQAISAYERAIRLAPKKGSYYYNLYRASSQKTFLSGKIDFAFQKARQLDPETINFYIAIDSPNMNRLVIDEVIRPAQLWDRFLDEWIGREGFLYRLFRAWFEKVFSRVPFLAPILFLGFLLALSRYSRQRRVHSRCPTCGSPTLRFYLGASEDEFVCFNCYRMFFQKEKLHPKVMEKKTLQVEAFQREKRRIGRILSFVSIGLADLWEERPLRGVLVLSLFFFFVLRFVYWDGVVRLDLPEGEGAIWRGAFWGGSFLIFYLLSLRFALRLKSKFPRGLDREEALLSRRVKRTERTLA